MKALGWFFLLSTPFVAAVGLTWCVQHSAPPYIYAGLLWGWSAQVAFGWRLLDEEKANR